MQLIIFILYTFNQFVPPVVILVELFSADKVDFYANRFLTGSLYVCKVLLAIVFFFMTVVLVWVIILLRRYFWAEFQLKRGEMRLNMIVMLLIYAHFMLELVLMTDSM